MNKLLVNKLPVFKKILLILFGFILAFLMLYVIDNFLGLVLNKAGYFKAMTPNVTEVYSTDEFNFQLTISSQGLRNPEVSAKKPTDVYRILALGDSFTYGWGVRLEDSWPKLLEKKLVIPGKRVEIINAGAPGLDTVDERKVCRAYLDQFNPDMVVLGFLGPEDLYQLGARDLNSSKVSNFITNHWPVLSSIGTPIIDSGWHGSAKPGDVINLSDVWKKEALNYSTNDPKILNNLDPRVRQIFLTGKINTALISTAYNDPEFVIKFLNKNNFDFALNALDSRIQKLKQRCTGDTPTVVVMLPTSNLVNKDFLTYRHAEGFQVSEDLLTFDLDTPVSKIIHKYGFNYLSVIPAFRSASDNFEYYYPWDYHMTPLGNQKVADFLVGELPQFISH